MGQRNYLIDGVSCSGKSTVCEELLRLGYQAIHGDEVLAYWGHPQTGVPVDPESEGLRTWMWDVEKVRSLVCDPSSPVTFFCGGSRNNEVFRPWMDGAFILEVDRETMERRLASRPRDAWGGTATEGEAFARDQWATRTGLPRDAVSVDASGPLSTVVQSILDRIDRTPR